jgi:hypothetical protein
MRNDSTSRRYFFRSIAGLAAGMVVARLPIKIKKKLEASTGDEDFIIVNGWVLTREDFAESEAQPDVI